MSNEAGHTKAREEFIELCRSIGIRSDEWEHGGFVARDTEIAWMVFDKSTQRISTLEAQLAYWKSEAKACAKMAIEKNAEVARLEQQTRELREALILAREHMIVYDDADSDDVDIVDKALNSGGG